MIPITITFFIIAALGVAALYWWPAHSIRQARRHYRQRIAEKVLELGAKLDGHQLWVALPFPEFEPDPEKYPEVWDEHPRDWQQVSAVDGSTLVLATGENVEALGCEWYVYATAAGDALEYDLHRTASPEDTTLPPGINPESVAPSEEKL